MENVNFEDIGKFIKELRIERKLKMDELGNILNVNKASISQWEKGKPISNENLYKLSKIFDISADELINGRRNDISNYDFLKKKYSLNSYNLLHDDDKTLLEYLAKVKNINDDFYDLKIKYYDDNLKRGDKSKLKFLENYFRFDSEYLTIRCNQDKSLKILDYDKIIKDEILEKDYESKRFELEKIFQFKNRNYVGLFLLRENMKVLEVSLSTLIRVDKDCLLEKEATSLSNDDFEKSKIIKILLNNDCHFMKRYKDKSKVIDEYLFEYIEGNIKETEELNRLLDYQSAYDTNHSKDNLIPNSITDWKEYSLDEYKSFIDEKKTKYYKALVNYKNSEPLKYYEALKEYYEN